ncbi:hypothetical protein J1N35_001217 [Gossypium stocksii]|uniref:Uncharacterized protein n=1 Tax=Gossypium stocksii TaxID=47602 RepID=A0A9D3WJQ4_9ROSI|nr:hypothetical protein J1N35_001217 [Gossypium stocksii]
MHHYSTLHLNLLQVIITTTFLWNGGHMMGGKDDTPLKQRGRQGDKDECRDGDEDEDENEGRDEDEYEGRGEDEKDEDDDHDQEKESTPQLVYKNPTCNR